MALTSTQKAQIRTYLGAPDNFRWKDVRLESVLDNLSPDSETIIADILAKLALVETQIATVVLPSAGIKRVDDVQFFEAAGMRVEAQKLGRSYITRLSIIVGVPIQNDYFGTGGYSGDDFYPGFGRGGNGSGTIPLG